MTRIKKLIYLLFMGLLMVPQVYAEWVDISPKVEINKTPQALDRVNRVLFSYVTITNNSAEALVSPVRLYITTPTIPVLNADGITDSGYSYFEVPGEVVSGGEITVRVDFQLARAELIFGAQIFQDVTPVEVDLQLIYHEFVELRGRDGHKGLFPLFSTPTAGDAVLHTFNSKDVKELIISVITDFGNSEFTAVLSDTSAEDKNEWYTEIVLPSTPFKLRFDMKSAYNSVVTTESGIITPSTFSLFLSLAEGHSFSVGDNAVLLLVKNHSNVDDSYEVIVKGNGGYHTDSLLSTTVAIIANSSKEILVPVIIPNNINTHTLTITAEVTGQASSVTEQANKDILITDEPLTLTELDSKAVINPGSCDLLNSIQETIDIMIAGSSHLDANNIDIDTVIIITNAAHIKPISSQLIDKGTAANIACDQQQADGKTDLVLTFSLQDILEKDNILDQDSIYVSIMYFTKTGSRYTHNATLVFP